MKPTLAQEKASLQALQDIMRWLAIRVQAKMYLLSSAQILKVLLTTRPLQ